MTFTKRISIERYKGDVAEDCAGLIEGETEDGEQWIIYMDAKGRPRVYWPRRDEGGGVMGQGLPLNQGPFGGVIHILTDGEDLDIAANPQAIVSTWPSWADNVEVNGGLAGMRGAIFAMVPGEGTPREKLRKFVNAYYESWMQDPISKEGSPDGGEPIE